MTPENVKFTDKIILSQEIDVSELISLKS